MNVKVGDVVHVKGVVTALRADQIYVAFNGVGSMHFYAADILHVEPKRLGDRTDVQHERPLLNHE